MDGIESPQGVVDHESRNLPHQLGGHVHHQQGFEVERQGSQDVVPIRFAKVTLAAAPGDGGGHLGMGHA